MPATSTWSRGLSARFDDAPNPLRSALAGLSAWRERRALYDRTVAELVSLTDRDLADLGIPRADIRRIAREAVFAAVPR